MKERLEFHIPPVGTVKATLHAESAVAFRWLRQAGEVDRLKSLDHLGAIRLAWDGAHHPRWEYITFIWSLVDRCADSDDLHLRSEVRLGTQRISSASELMKCWALLLNAGHLQQTFAAERALLFELWGHRKSRDDFPQLVSADLAIQRWAAQILRRGRYYHLYQALAFIRLRAMTSFLAETLPWEAILGAYVLEDFGGSKALERVRAVYHRLRRAAHLALDTHYTPSVLRVDPSQLFTDVRALSRLIAGAATGENRDDALSVLERHLYEHIYLGEPVIAAIASRELELRGLIRASVRDRDISETVEDLAKGELQRRTDPRPVTTIGRLPVWVPRPFDELLVPAENPRTLQYRWDRKLRMRAPEVRVSAWTVPYGRDCVLQVDVGSYHDLSARLLAFRLLFEAAAGLRRRNAKWIELLGEDQLHQLLFESIGVMLVVAALTHLRNGESLRWELSGQRGHPVAMFTTAESAARHIRKLLSMGDLPGDLRAEYEGVGRLLEGERANLVAVSIARSVGYGADSREQRVELDGCVVKLVDGGVCVTLLEAKQQSRRGCREAGQQLKKTLGTLGWTASVRTEKSGDLCWAYSEVTVKPNTLGGVP